MLSRVIGLKISVSTFSWIKSSRVLKNVIDMKKMSSRFLLLLLFHNISISPPWSTNHTHVCQQQDGFTVQDIFFLHFRIHISQISTISTIQTKIPSYHLKWYVTTCFQIRSQIILSVFFGYVLGLYCVSSLMWQFSTYF